jgi:hypothetical protein
MYAIMVDYVEHNRRYPRRVGKMANSLDKAIARAKKAKGYVLCGVKVVWC